MKKQGHLSARKVVIAEHNRLFAVARSVAEPWSVCVKKNPLSRERIFYWSKTR